MHAADALPGAPGECRLAGGTLHSIGALACPGLGNAGAGAGGGAAGTAPLTAVECSTDGHTVFMGAADGGVWAADLRGYSDSSCSQQAPRPVLLHHQGAGIVGLSWEHPWLAVADAVGIVVLIDAGTATAAGQAAVEGTCSSSSASGATCSGSGQAPRRSKSGPASGRRQPARQVRTLHSNAMAGSGSAVQCISLGGFFLAAGLDCGRGAIWDSSQGLQQQAAAAATRLQKAERRQRNQDRQQQQQQKQGPRSAVGRSRSYVPGLRSGNEAGGQGLPQEQSTHPSSHSKPPGSRMRVPAPLHPDALAAAGGSCRQQATWQVLRSSRPAAAAPGAASTGSLAP